MSLQEWELEEISSEKMSGTAGWNAACNIITSNVSEVGDN